VKSIFIARYLTVPVKSIVINRGFYDSQAGITHNVHKEKQAELGKWDI